MPLEDVLDQLSNLLVGEVLTIRTLNRDEIYVYRKKVGYNDDCFIIERHKETFNSDEPTFIKEMNLKELEYVTNNEYAIKPDSLIDCILDLKKYHNVKPFNFDLEIKNEWTLDPKFLHYIKEFYDYDVFTKAINLVLEERQLQTTMESLKEGVKRRRQTKINRLTIEIQELKKLLESKKTELALLEKQKLGE